MTQLSNSNINAVADLKPGYTLGAADVVLLQEMARRLLAVEGREPVGVVRAVNTLSGMTGLHVSLFEKLPVGTEVYAAPQPAPVAQPVQVPDGLLSAMEEVLRISDRDHEAWQRAREGIAACRAAMLKAEPVSQPYTLPEDTKRLDWLDAQNKRLNEYHGTSYGWKFDANFQRNAMMLNDSNYPVMNVRQAIDEAMRVAPQEPTK